ncbi:membrane protein [Arenimonas soli]|uniref:Membrane protein n=1 Tax=Arenimonas soli TaxID=2269504 RepID=A0ABQ1HBE5_9GAMM|nr:metal-dependent hydrolase [Arenimonas soli]GGA67739.1 membrane protein [Arenimonas soli]
MDSLTQIVLGAAIAGAIAPARHRRAALAAGAALGTLPDLDSLPMWFMGLDPVTNMTWHRGPSHSLLVLLPLAALLWSLFKRTGGRVAEAPTRWFWAITLALVTHPLLDAFTVYGTQLWWPLPPSPAMWASLFIIDPLYTLPLLLGCLVALVRGWRPSAQKALVAGLALSSVYLGWSLAAKAMVDRAAERTLAAQGLQDAPRFSVPMPFNTLLWRVVVMTPDGFLEGERSLVADDGPMLFRAYASDTQALAETKSLPVVRRLLWFNHGFMKAEVRDQRLVLSDLRMGAEPDYSFRFVVAERDGGGWRAYGPEQAQWPWEARRRLSAMWERIWTRPPGELQAIAAGTRVVPVQAAAANSGDTPATSASK